jgi:hypothetical protein
MKGGRKMNPKPSGTYYFNNCRGRVYLDHYERHGVNDCFYDLETFDPQASEATDLKPGQKCIVATVSKVSRSTLPLRKRPVSFDEYVFKCEVRLPDLGSKDCRVLRGKFVKNIATYPQGVARKRFPMFFNKLGHFLQKSTIGKF